MVVGTRLGLGLGLGSGLGKRATIEARSIFFATIVF